MQETLVRSCAQLREQLPICFPVKFLGVALLRTAMMHVADYLLQTSYMMVGHYKSSLHRDLRGWRSRYLHKIGRFAVCSKGVVDEADSICGVQLWKDA